MEARFTMRNVTQNAKNGLVPARPTEAESGLCRCRGDLNKKIAARAYELFERRGKIHGHDVDDWLSAESEVVWELH